MGEKEIDPLRGVKEVQTPRVYESEFVRLIERGTTGEFDLFQKLGDDGEQQVGSCMLPHGLVSDGHKDIVREMMFGRVIDV